MYSNNKQITLPSGSVPAIHREITKHTNKQTQTNKMYSNNKQITLPSGCVPAIHREITKQTNKQTKCIAIINKLLDNLLRIHSYK